MIGPGNDSGDPEAVLDRGYDGLIRHMATPLTGIAAIAAVDEDGEDNVVLWSYNHHKPALAQMAVSEDPMDRLRVIYTALKYARVLAVEEGFTVMGE